MSPIIHTWWKILLVLSQFSPAGAVERICDRGAGQVVPRRFSTASLMAQATTTPEAPALGPPRLAPCVLQPYFWQVLADACFGLLIRCLIGPKHRNTFCTCPECVGDCMLFENVGSCAAAEAVARVLDLVYSWPRTLKIRNSSHETNGHRLGGLSCSVLACK